MIISSNPTKVFSSNDSTRWLEKNFGSSTSGTLNGMETMHHFNDYGNIILEIDKLVRSDRDKLYRNSLGRENHGNPSSPRHAPKQASALKPPNPSEFPPAPEMMPVNPSTHLISPLSFNGCLSSLIGEPEPGVECVASKDMRQVRLFKTRFCSYGSDCPYMLRGKCLYAHNRDEIRFRPPPPPSYKMSSKPSNKTSPVSSPKGVSPIKSVWALPENTTSEHGGVSPQSLGRQQNVVPTYSLFDFMPPRTSTTNINYSDFPSL